MEEIESIIGFDALYESTDKCKKGVLYKDSAAYFVTHGIEEVLKLEEQLKNGTYKARKPRKVQIYYPKRREAVSIAFRDRVYQRSLNDNAIYPAMSRSFIKSNCACQKRKGTDFARDLLAEYMRRAFRKYGLNVYVLQCDIKKYYQSMKHDTAKKRFRENLSDWSYKKAVEVLDGQYEGNTGFNPGSQMVQIAGISVPSPLDHFIKERLGIKWYIRYQDDFVFIHSDKSHLEYCKEEMGQKLEEMGLRLHPEKTRIYPITAGIDFLGFTFKLTETGKVLRLIDPKNVKHERKKLRRMVAKAKYGEITREKVDQCYQSWRSHASGSKRKHVSKRKKRHNYKNNTYKILQRMDKFYADLWKGE